MIRALIGKELRQHGFAVVFLLLLPFAILILISSNALLRRVGGGGFEAVHLLLITVVPLACLVLGQLLIAQEFRHKTQLFLEGLPLPRWRMLAVKFGLGLVLILSAAALALIYTGWTARSTEAMTPQFATLLAAKTAGWALCVYALCFAHSFLGRYRIFFGVAVVFGLYAMSTMDVPLGEFGPFALIDQRFAYERFIWPSKALAVTGALILLFAAIGFYLGLVRDSTVAALLAEKMSAREKVFLTFLSLVFAIVSGWVNEHHENATPVQMPGATEADRSVVRVMASAAVDAPTRAEIAALQRTAMSVAMELDALTKYLGCRTYPPVFIVHRRDLGGDEFTNGELKPSQGVLVRTNLTSAKFKTEDLSRWLLRETLITHTNGIVERERNEWILDGFEWWWPRSQHGELSAWNEALHAVQAAPKPLNLTPQDLHNWYTVKKKLGLPQTRLLAGSVLALLAERHGTANLHRFLADRFGEAQPVDARGWLRDMLRPNSARLRVATGLSEAALVAEWHKAMATTAP